MNSFLFILLVFVAILLIVFVMLEIFVRPSLKHLFFGIIAVIAGLMIGALLAEPLSKLPSYWGEYLPLMASIIFAFAGLIIYRKLIPTIDGWIDKVNKLFSNSGFLSSLSAFSLHKSLPNDVIIDTSAIIDGRVSNIAKLGYLPQKILIPRFILTELQNIADSKDIDRRNKGKRGLAVIEELKETKGMLFKIITEEVPEVHEVDHKLVLLAKRLHAQLLTTDFNLNKVATAENIRVLNINELAQQLRPQLLPGDELKVRLVHLGKDHSQGVGYLEDGTMIVVENSGLSLGKEVKVKVARSLQTAAGKMYFATLRKAR